MKKRTTGWSRPALAVVASLALMGSAVAAPTDADRIADLEKKLELLTQRLLQVEGGTAARPDKAPPAIAEKSVAPAALPTPEPEASPAHAQAAPAARHADNGVPIRAFVDVGYARDKPDPTGRKGGFGVGTVALYMTPSFGDHIKSIIELVFEQEEDGGMVVDLERVQLGYTFSDALTAWAGRFHTPLGYWNAAFHHGAQIQTSVLRPRFIAFEDQGGILPEHAVGLLGSGSVPLAGGRLKYDLFFGNGTPIVDGVLTVSGYKDDDNKKMLGGNLRHEFGGSLEGLTLGVHALSTQVSAYDAAGAVLGRTRLNVGGGFATLERNGWELMGEYYAFRNRDLAGGTGTHASWAAFGQVGYTVADALTPYARFEKAALDQTDSYFANMNSGRSYQRTSVGLRYELNATTALKLEVGHTSEDQGGIDVKSRGLRAQVAARF